MKNADEILQQEFNEWAAAGRGEEMQGHHISIAEQTIGLMDLTPGERVLDLGCGAGWATRILAKAVAGASGTAVGLDISDEMIARAKASSKSVPNAQFICSSAERIPEADGTFDKVLSIESFYYYPDQELVLKELLRVTKPCSKVFILINLYRDNPYSLRWVDALKVPVHARSEREYIDILQSTGFTAVEAKRIPDLTPTPEQYSGKWFKNSEELRDFKRIGALLLIAEK